MLSKERAGRTFADFKVGDVFVHHRYPDAFVIVKFHEGDAGFMDVVNLYTGALREFHLRVDQQLDDGYEVIRGAVTISQNRSP